MPEAAGANAGSKWTSDAGTNKDIFCAYSACMTVAVIVTASNTLLTEECAPCEQAAVEEGIVIGGGCTLLKLAQAVEGIKAGLDNDEQKVRQSSWTLF